MTLKHLKKQAEKLGATFNDIQRMVMAFHGSPHSFSKEILVENELGEREYLVGDSDYFPEVPKGYKLIEKFPFGRFRSDKIGTGEGAQAFGWGLYFTDLESIARNYAVKLADVNPIEYIKINGRILNINHKYFKEVEQGISNYEQLLGKQPNTVSDIVSFMDESDLKNRLEKGELTLDFKINNLPNRNLYKVSLHKGKTVHFHGDA